MKSTFKQGKIRLTAWLAIVCLLFSVQVPAYAEPQFAETPMRPADGFYTVFTDIEGGEHRLEGVPETAALEYSAAAEQIASYEVFRDDGESVLRAELHDIIRKGNVSLGEEVPLNGYYSVRFELSAEDNTEVFLTGLSDSNLKQVQEELLAAVLENSEFSMESVDFIDTEKTNIPDDGDDMLCWSASTANMLHYTGWGEHAGFKDADEIFDLFNESFTDVGSLQIFGLEWFFNGSNAMQGTPGWADVKEYGTSGKYLEDYSAWEQIRQYDVTRSHAQMVPAMEDLENGYGAGIALGWVDEGGFRYGGHAITVWGYICDNDYVETAHEYYQALIVSDSDSDMPDSDRRDAPNKLHVLNMVPYTENAYDTWAFEGYFGGSGVLESFTMLRPYDDEIPYETDSDASKNTIKNADLHTYRIMASNDAGDTEFAMNVFTEKDEIYLKPQYENFGGTVCNPPIEYTANLVHPDGIREELGEFTYKEAIQPFSNTLLEKTPAVQIDPLHAGDYTVQFTVNGKKSAEEAFYYNNTSSYHFTVTDDEYDLSGASMTADIGDFSLGMAEAAIHYQGLDDIAQENPEYTLMQSYFADGRWSAWSAADTDMGGAVGGRSNGAALPEKCNVFANGEKVRFRLVIKLGEDKPCLNLYSNECPLRYLSLTVTADPDNPEELTPLENGAKSLVNGEKLTFTIQNTSTGDFGSQMFGAVVYAQKDEELVELWRQDNLSLSTGESTAPIVFSGGWAQHLSGTYQLIAAAVNGDAVYSAVPLGTLRVEENISYEVTTGQDIINPYDDQISLREAAAYLQQSAGDEAVTFSDSVAMVSLDEPIEVDGKVVIDGTYSPSGNETRPAVFLVGQGMQLFNILENGNLKIISVILHSGVSEEDGGAIANNGGKVYAEQCMMVENKSRNAGGAIYANGGTTILKNCSFRYNSSGNGSAVAISNGAKLDLLGCSFLENEAKNGTLYNDDGTVTVVYSTFAQNTSETGGGAVTSSQGDTNLVGCLVTLNGDVDLAGSVNVYGSYYTAVDGAAVSVDETSVCGPGNEVFVCYGDGYPFWDNNPVVNIMGYYTELSPKVLEGICVKNSDDGKIVFTTKDGTVHTAEIDSAFTNEEYLHDMAGRPHEGLFGADSRVCWETKFVDMTPENEILIYTPGAQDAVLIHKYEDTEGRMTEVSLTDIALKAGTNVFPVPADSGRGDDEIESFFLWESIESMMPLCTSYRPGYIKRNGV